MNQKIKTTSLKAIIVGAVFAFPLFALALIIMGDGEAYSRYKMVEAIGVYSLMVSSVTIFLCSLLFYFLARGANNKIAKRLLFYSFSLLLPVFSYRTMISAAMDRVTRLRSFDFWNEAAALAFVVVAVFVAVELVFAVMNVKTGSLFFLIPLVVVVSVLLHIGLMYFPSLVLG